MTGGAGRGGMAMGPCGTRSQCRADCRRRARGCTLLYFACWPSIALAILDLYMRGFTIAKVERFWISDDTQDRADYRGTRPQTSEQARYHARRASTGAECALECRRCARLRAARWLALCSRPLTTPAVSRSNAMPARDRAIGFGAYPKCLCAPAWSPGESKARPG